MLLMDIFIFMNDKEMLLYFINNTELIYFFVCEYILFFLKVSD